MGGTVMIAVMKTGRIGKVRIIHAEFCSFLIHEIDEGGDTAADRDRSCLHGIGTAGQENSIQQVFHRYRIAWPEAGDAGIGLNEAIPHRIGDRDFLIEIEMLNCQDRSHHLRHRSRFHPLFAIAVQQHLVRIGIHEIAVRAGDGRRIGFFVIRDGSFRRRCRFFGRDRNRCAGRQQHETAG